MDRISSSPRHTLAAVWSQKPLIAAKQISLTMQGESVTLAAPAGPTGSAADIPPGEPGHVIDIVV